ncbi:MAG: MucR family transcriptional regulator [Erythrobacter sp.]
MLHEDHETLVTLTADIVSAHVSNNSMPLDGMAKLIQSVYGALNTAKDETSTNEPQEPAVPIKRSVRPDYIICLEDGKKLKMLKRHLRTNFNMTPHEYRVKWNLPQDYPMVAPSYSALRRDLARKIGLGLKPRGRGKRK